jgi:hypothetical protein
MAERGMHQENKDLGLYYKALEHWKLEVQKYSNFAQRNRNL